VRVGDGVDTGSPSTAPAQGVAVTDCVIEGGGHIVPGGHGVFAQEAYNTNDRAQRHPRPALHGRRDRLDVRATPRTATRRTMWASTSSTTSSRCGPRRGGAGLRTSIPRRLPGRAERRRLRVQPRPLPRDRHHEQRVLQRRVVRVRRLGLCLDEGSSNVTVTNNVVYGTEGCGLPPGAAPEEGGGRLKESSKHSRMR